MPFGQEPTFDDSGLGRSTGTPRFDSLSLANDAKDLAEALNLKRIIIGGWSLGGMAAQTVTTHYPELVSHTILIGTVPPGKNGYPAEQLFFEIMIGLVIGKPLGFVLASALVVWRGLAPKPSTYSWR